MLEIHNLIKQYCHPSGETATVLDVADLVVHEGEQLIIAGPSGSGKTTLLHLIAGLLPPTAGEILWDGARLDRMPEAQRDRWRAQNIGYIFQSFNLLPALSAEENILAACAFAGRKWTDEYRKAAKELLARVGLIDKAHCKPSRLSMGEQQRVAVARALVNRPALILADEPTASLDQENIEKVLALIQSLCKEKNSTLLLATHDPIVLARFSRRYEMRSGGKRP